MLLYLKKAINEFNISREYRKTIPAIHEKTKGMSAEKLVDFVLSHEWKRFFWMIQIPSEIKWLLNKVEQIKPKVVVEIGTRMGGTLFLFTKVSKQDSTVISVDFPDGHGGGYSKSRADFYRSYAVPPQHVVLIKGDSHAASTKIELENILDGKKIDFLFIDGDHSYNGVKMDFDMYSPLVRSRGLVGFHDNKPTSENSWSGVIPYWEEIKDKYKSEEFFGSEDKWGGMGIIQMP
jgi:cephalosporin hydroxylase